MGIPWWLTALAGSFAGIFAIIALFVSGFGWEFGVLSFIAGIFWAASLMRTSEIRDFITSLATYWPW